MKIGTRVHVYGSFAPAEGGSVRYLDGDLGTVIKEDRGAGLEVDLDVPFYAPFTHHPQRIDGVHPKQLRRFKKVKK